MLGRNAYTREEFDQSKAADKKVATALATFEPLYFNNLTIALDRFFVHGCAR